MYQAAANTSNYQAAVVGSKLLGNLTSFKPGGFATKDGSGTERGSNY